MVDRPASASPSNEGNGRLPQSRQVDLLPWILIPSEHHAGRIPIQEEQRTRRTGLTKKPICVRGKEGNGENILFVKVARNGRSTGLTSPQ